LVSVVRVKSCVPGAALAKVVVAAANVALLCVRSVNN
jgi:hypothetical protein